MGDQYELPEDLGTLTDEQIESALSASASEMLSIRKSGTATTKTIPTLRALAASIAALEAEKGSRLTAAAETVAEMDRIFAETFGEDAVASDTAPETEPAEEAEPAAEVEVIEPTTVVTASSRRPVNIAAARAAMSGTPSGLAKYLPAETVSGIEIVASVDVPGYRPGQEINLGQVTEGVMSRAQGLKTGGGGTGLVASIRIPFPEDQVIKDASSASEGTLTVDRVADQTRLKGGELAASGGWCAPSETIYDVAGLACPDMLWDLPEIQLNRGGLRFFRPPVLDVAALTFTWTEAQDIAAATQPAGPEKPCYVIPCPAPLDVRAVAIGVCLSVGILTERYFPELVSRYVSNSLIAHEIRVKQYAFQAALDSAATVDVTIRPSFAGYSAVFEALALQAADMIERYQLCEGTPLEAVLPWWSKNLMLTDLARQEGKLPGEVTEDDLRRAFATIGVSIQWARGLPPAVPTDIGGPTAVTTWPGSIQFLIYPAGNFQLARGPEINIGVIIDSVTVATNDQKIFSEEGIALVDRMGLARAVTVAVCPNGEVGARNTVDICAAEA